MFLLDVMNGWDMSDSTSVRRTHTSCSDGLSSDNPDELLKGLKIGVPKVGLYVICVCTMVNYKEKPNTAKTVLCHIQYKRLLYY